ncbi:MAG: phosphoribosyltransferase [Anaerolineales bacterium]
MAMRRELISWEEVDRLVDHLLPQFRTGYDGMVLITRGGIIPGGILSEAMGLKVVLTAAVDFPFEAQQATAKLLAWPQFLQFPEDAQLRGRKILIVDDIWASGRTITAVRGKVEAAAGEVETCVLHFNPYRSLFSQARPDYYAAVTDAFIVYPWEIDRRGTRALLDQLV